MKNMGSGYPESVRPISRRRFTTLLAGMVSTAALSSLTACSSDGVFGRPNGAQRQPGDGEYDLEVRDVEAVSTDQELTLDGLARTHIESLTLEQKVAQLFFVRPEDITGADVVTEADDAMREGYQAYPVGGIIFSLNNLENPDQSTAMLESSAQTGVDTVQYAPFISVDEEGGTVVRIADNPGFDVPNVGDMCDVGNVGDAEYAKDVAKTIADYLLPLGFNTDFAPCCDVANNPESDTMLYRSFGSDAEEVAKMVAAQVEGFTEAGILCCAKHFPGIGAAMGDSHEENIYSEKTLDEIDGCELVPFRAAIEAGVPMVMVGHISMPNIVGDDTPASLSSAIVTDILRKQLRYDGIVITDSLGMGAVSAYGPQAVVMALQAGCDMPLMPEDFIGAYQAVLDAVADGTLTEERIDESLLRIMRVKIPRS